MIPESYFVQNIPLRIASPYIKQNHYSHGHHNGASPCFGLLDGIHLIGVCMFACPCSENVRSSLFGVEHKDSVVELHRLHILDITPRNTETWFLSRAFMMLARIRPQTKGVISFADPTEGHAGTIYKAFNGIYMGTSAPATFYRDEDGRLRHPRQNGCNISKSEALARGWTPCKRMGKHRFVWVLDRKWKNKLLLKPADALDSTAPRPCLGQDGTPLPAVDRQATTPDSLGGAEFIGAKT